MSKFHCLHTLYCVLCTVTSKLFIIFPYSLAHWYLKAVAFIKISSFSLALYVASCVMYIQIQKPILFPHWFGSLAVNAGAIIKISSFSLALYVASCVMYIQIQKPILFPHWFGLLAVNAGAIIEILIISHQLSAVWFILSNQVYKI